MAAPSPGSTMKIHIPSLPPAIAFVTASLGTGGAERILVWLANRFAVSGNRVRILRLEGPERPVFYTPDSTVELASLDLSGESAGLFSAIATNWHRVRRLRRALAAFGPDRIVSFGTETNVLSLLAAGRRWPVVVAERCDPNFYPANRIWRFLRAATYPRAARVVFQTRAAQAALSGTLRSTVIANPVDRPAPVLPDEVAPHPTDLVAMGRLVPQKGFDILLEAIARLSPSHCRPTLRILGDGQERGLLEEQARRLGISQQIEFAGVVRSPVAYLRAAKIFVMPSRFEGFPNALCEAMAVGLAVVATDCPSGPSDIVADGKTGVLVAPESPDALATAIGQLLGDEATRQKMAQAAAGIADVFGPDRIFEEWQRAIV